MHVAETDPQLTEHEMWEPPDLVMPHHFNYSQRIEVRGKFLFQAEEKFWVKGVTYGTFKPGENGDQFPSQDLVRSDFEGMASAGINTVRTYLPPPSWLLDLAQENGLRVMVGLAWEQHVTFLDDRRLLKTIEDRVRDGIRSSRQHPAILGYSVGNEIPGSIVRWHGRRKIEKFIHRLYKIAKQEDPEALVTYVNYPTTEYLQLQFLDLCSFNVYLEKEEVLKSYLARLQNLAGGKPLLMTEIGFDSRRKGEQEQAEQLQWQIRTAFAEGCAGTFIFAWTDEWHRGGFAIEDWDFGLCSRERKPKPALQAVTKAYEHVPFPSDSNWPRISIVLCSYNGARTIRGTLESLRALDYSDYEVIVINDGSTDETANIICDYDVISISTENRGLSNARNTGWQAATGDIVAYIDDDAYPDPHWLQFLASTYLTTDYAAVGGSSPAPAGDGLIADCVANAPGRPVHVLLTDTEAEHIPGCNMSFKRYALEAIGGFDPRFRVAGDDVDACWQVQEQGWKIGYHAGALNWHHCRDSLKAYWRQQLNYGRAEALLEEKWPEKYNSVGHLTWRGRLYGKGIAESLPGGRWRIYHGQWGSAPFQSIYEPAKGVLSALPLMPEWYFVVGLLAGLSLLGIAWQPLLWVLPLLVLSIILPVTLAVVSASKAEFPTHWPKLWQRVKLRGLLSLMHLTQPQVRLLGRLRHGLTPWRKKVGKRKSAIGKSRRSFKLWSQTWRPPDEWIRKLESILRADGTSVILGGDFDSWDLEVRGGLLGRARILMAQEEHGGGRQQVRILVRSSMSTWSLGFALLFMALGMLASFDGEYVVGSVLTGMAALIALRSRNEALSAIFVFQSAIQGLCDEIQSGA